jgi:uncharacterized membrane protein YdbT with pleckstrin-like domain
MAAGYIYIMLDRWMTSYRLTSQRLIIENGVFVRHTQEIELHRVNDVKLVQGPIEKLIGVGTVVMGSVSGTDPITLTSIPKSQFVYEFIRGAGPKKGKHNARAV